MQVDDLVEYYWVALPLTDATSYASVRAQLEALMAARKVTRNFNPVQWGSDRPKSSLDGQRESVIKRSVYKNQPPEQLRKQFGVQPGEQLSGVGLLKRHGRLAGGDAHRFFSTSHVAALPLLAQMTAADEPHVHTYIEALEGIEPDDLGQVPGKPHAAFGRYDGHLLFEERLKEFFEGTDAATKERLHTARAALTKFLKDTVNGQRPLPYYTVLLADGDRMGTVIDNQPDTASHQRLSQQLARFAGKVREIVRNHDGWLIYSGGDDVLAFLPLHTVLACARVLADTFADELGTFTNKHNTPPTLSIGVAIAHHMEPMSDVLELARGAEKAAKKTRNALAVTLSKRSGADRTVAGSWEPVPTLSPDWASLDRRIMTFVKLHCSEAFPDGAAFELHELYLRMGQSLSAKALEMEAIRILKRKRAQGGSASIDDDTVKNLASVLTLPDMTLEKIANEVIIARIFADAERLAHPGKSKRAKELS
jgi:CRISPR-associated protein Cmr2